MGTTTISWTNKTWNPTRGCRRVSPGCENCYAERQAYRFSGAGQPYEGLVQIGKQGPRWTGRGRLVASMLAHPLSWKKPARIFVDSMSDLFFEAFTNEEIAAVFGVMAACPQHTFQVLTKRPKRMREWFAWVESEGVPADHVIATCASNYIDVDVLQWPWPLPNVWLGVSVEDQHHADERIPELLTTPAAVRFVSYEPAIGPVDFARWIFSNGGGNDPVPRNREREPGLDWIIVGGESGPDARPFAEEWAARTVQQCREAGVACFVKQMGSYLVSEGRTATIDGEARSDVEPWMVAPNGELWAWRAGLKDRKGEDMAEWPADLRVREWPAVVAR